MSWLDAVRRLLGIAGPVKDPSTNDKSMPQEKSTDLVSPVTPSTSRIASEHQPILREKQPNSLGKTGSSEGTAVPNRPEPPKKSTDFDAPIPSPKSQVSEHQSPPSEKQPIPFTGDMTQFPFTKPAAPKQLLNIGLDFGTAFTKVVIGETRTCYAVPFELKTSENPYLLPCILYIDDSGTCALQPLGESFKAISDLKMKLLEGTPDDQDLGRMVAFIALVFRHTRLWFFEKLRSTYEGRSLDWNVNVGVPTDSYHQEQLVTTYQLITKSAWALSVIPDPVTIHAANQILTSVSHGRYSLPKRFAGLRERLIHKDAFGLFPEFVAQVAGYVRSPLRKPDLHMMVDVGAGTVDISIFNVHEADGDDIFPVFAKAVKPFGTHYLMKHRENKLPSGVNVKWSLHDKTPSQGEFLQKVKIPLKQLKEIDNNFTMDIGTKVRDLLKYTKEKRYPCSPRWQCGVPTFLCGGGGKVDVYSELIGRFENSNHTYRIKLEQLPQPQRLSAPQLPTGSYDRLSVAYGLSHNALDIGRIIQANEIDDHNIPPNNPDPYADNFVRMDDV